MNANPLVSIVLPTHNGSRYLAESLESILAQTFTGWELIIVDDCSSDRTPEIIEQYRVRDGRIRAFRNENNLRLPNSLNRGFAEARGEFLTWTSDDNHYRPIALERMLMFLQTHPDVDLVYAGMSWIDEAGQVKDTWLPPRPEMLCWGDPVGACFLYRRRLQETLGGYRPEFELVEDYEFWLRASLKFRLHNLEEDLYMYRLHPESLTNRKATEVKHLTISLRALYLPQLHWVCRRDRGVACLLLAEACLTAKDYRAARRTLWRAIRDCPLHLLRFHKTTLARAVVGERVGSALHSISHGFRRFDRGSSNSIR